MRGDDRYICRHARLQLLLRIADANDRVVGDDVLHRDRRVAHLDYFSLEAARRKGVDREFHVLVDRHTANVGLGDVGIDLLRLPRIGKSNVSFDGNCIAATVWRAQQAVNRAMVTENFRLSMTIRSLHRPGRWRRSATRRARKIPRVGPEALTSTPEQTGEFVRSEIPR